MGGLEGSGCGPHGCPSHIQEERDHPLPKSATRTKLDTCAPGQRGTHHHADQGGQQRAVSQVGRPGWVVLRLLRVT